jgi:hypothetical protein
MNLLVGVSAALAVVGAGLYQVHFKYILNSLGILGRDIHAINNDHCRVISELSACESEL